MGKSHGAGALLAAATLAMLPGRLLAQNGELSGVASAQGHPASGVVIHLEPIDWSPTFREARGPVVDQQQLRFFPQTLAVTPGTTVKFLNSDPILHNIFSPSPRSESFNLGTFPRSETRSFTFREPGPHVLLCHVHPEMVGYVVVVPTPHHSVSRFDGGFRIDDIPPGRYRLGVWHYRLKGEPQTIIIRPGARMRLDIELEPRSR